MGLFLTIVLSVWAAMHAYVFWRIASLPWITTRFKWWTIAGLGFVLFLSFPFSRFLEDRLPEAIIYPFEYLTSNWVGILFLLLCGFLLADILTLGGFLWRSRTGEIRTAATIVALALSVFALIQGHRAPAVTEHEISLAGLPDDLDGTVLVAFSDIHLGAIIREGWLEQMVEQVNALEPDIIVAVGDIVDGNADRVQSMAPILGRLKAPLGVWGVSGNHDYYANLDRSLRFFEKSGIRVLRDEAAEAAPGLVIAGVDDLTARRQLHLGANNPVEHALAGRPEGATIFLSHTPWQAEVAARLDTSLMIAGHTHNGQIWPFTYLVRTRYPLVSGRYTVDGMTVLVGRGTATWGPRMRLWQRGEILRISLRSQ